MDELTFTVKAIAKIKKLTIEQLAKECDISVNHLKSVSAGRAHMLYTDAKKLSKFSGIPLEKIEEN